MKHELSEPTLSPRDPYRLTENELNSGYDDDANWGHYLYKKHTNLGQKPLSSEVAATLSTHDLEAIMHFAFVSDKDLKKDKIAGDSIKNCSHELVLRENK